MMKGTCARMLQSINNKQSDAIMEIYQYWGKNLIQALVHLIIRYSFAAKRKTREKTNLATGNYI